jgi:hypothetical protein
VALDLPRHIAAFKNLPAFFLVLLSLLSWPEASLSQKTQTQENGPPKYDLHAEVKAKGMVDEVTLLPFGTRKDFRELTIKDGEAIIHIYMCPKPFEDEMGISFSKGDQISVTGSKIKYQDAEVILARELVKGEDTLLFRDEKGTPVWNTQTGK